MALIKCPECGKEISDKAQSCIHCGCPIQTQKIESKLIIKALKHPNEEKIIGYSFGVPMYGKSTQIYICTTNGHCVAEIITGQTISINVNADMEIYASFYPIGKKGLFNLGEKTKSNIVRVCSGELTKIQIGYSYGNLTKIILNKVNEFDSI